MLKLERDKNTREVCIRSNRGETLFTKLFLIALSTAIALHAAFFLIFRIEKGHENYPQLILPPINVQAVHQQFESAEHYTLTEYEEQMLAQHKSYEPVPSMITIPPISPRIRENLYYPEIEPDEPALFSSLEAEYILNQLFPLEISLPMPKLIIHLSGPLKDFYPEEITHPLFNETVTLPIRKIHQKRYTFDVIVDNKTGKIIWYEKKQESPEEIQTLLLALNFSMTPSKRTFTKGRIEMLATEQMKKDD